MPETFIPCHQAGETFQKWYTSSPPMVLLTSSQGIWLYRRLAKGLNVSELATDARLYEDFIRAVPVFMRDPAESEMAMCRLFLRHPTKPTAEPAYLHIMSWSSERSHEQSQAMRDFLASTNYGVAGHIWAFVLSTAQMLHQGSPAAAKHVLDVAKQRRPDIFCTDGKPVLSRDRPHDKFAMAQTSRSSHAPDRIPSTAADERVRAMNEAYIRQGHYRRDLTPR